MAQLCLLAMGKPSNARRVTMTTPERVAGWRFATMTGLLRMLENPTPDWCSSNVDEAASFGETCVTVWASKLI